MIATVGFHIRLNNFARLLLAGSLLLAYSTLLADFYIGDVQIHRQARTDLPVNDGKTVFGGGQWMSIGPGGNLLVSEDAEHWTQRKHPELVSARSLAYGNGRWIIATFDNGIQVSTDAGATWSAANLPTKSASQRFGGCAYLDGYFVAWSTASEVNDEGQILYSADAETRHGVPGPPPHTGYREIWYDAGVSRFCVLTKEATVYATEQLGEEWILDYSPPYPVEIYASAVDSAPQQVAFLLKANINNAYDYDWRETYRAARPFLVTRAQDGSWNQSSDFPEFGLSIPRLRIAENRIYMLNPGNNGTILSSADGLTWDEPKSSDWAGRFSASYANGWWFARTDSRFGAESLDGLERSSDLLSGEMVMKYETPFHAERQPLVTDGTTSVIAFGVNAVRLDIATQQTQSITLPDHAENWIGAATWDGNRYAASGEGRSIYVSTDGLNWTTLVAPQPEVEAFNSMAFGDGIYVASTMKGVWSSPDLVTWTERRGYSLITLWSAGTPRVVRDGGRFWLCLPTAQAVEDAPGQSTAETALFSSTDGEHWVPAVPDGASYGPHDASDFAGGETVQSSNAWAWNGISLLLLDDDPFIPRRCSAIEEGSGFLVAAAGTEIYVKRSRDDGSRWSKVLHSRLRELLPWAEDSNIVDLVQFGDRFYFQVQFTEVFGSFVLDDQPIIDTRGPGEIRILPGGFLEESDGYGMHVQLTRENGSVGAISVKVSPISGTAIEGVDFSADPEIVSWEAGELGTKLVRIGNMEDDLLIEGPETITVVLSEPTGGLVLDPAASTLEFPAIDSPFEDWSFHHFGSDTRRNSPDADPDHDDISNLVEFRLRLDPTVDDARILLHWMRPLVYPEIGQVGRLFAVDKRDPWWGMLGWTKTEGSLDDWGSQYFRSQTGSSGIDLEYLQLAAPEDDAASSFWRFEIQSYAPRGGRSIE